MGRRHGKKIDVTRWISLFGFTNTHAAAGSVGVNLLAAGTIPETLMRMRGEFFCTIDANQAPAILMRITAGVIVVPGGQSTTVLHEPNGDADAPWLWYTAFALSHEEAVTDVIEFGGGHKRIEIDSKAMRIIRPDQELQLVVTSTTLGGGADVNWAFSARGLLGS